MMVAILSRRSQKQILLREIRYGSRFFVYLSFVSRYRCTVFVSFVIITMFAVVTQTPIDVLGVRRLLLEISSDSNIRGSSNSIGDNISSSSNNNNNDAKEYDFFNITFLNNIQTMKCGGRKCFIIAEDENEESNESNNIKKIGYIIAQDNRIIHQNRENPISSDMYKAWEIAKTLKHEYNSSTLLQGPPQKLWRDEKFFEKLNSIEIQTDPGHFIPPGVGKFSSESGPLIVQQSEIIPQPSMMWHINMYLSNENYRKPMLYADFISNHVAQQMGNNYYNIEQFESRLIRNLNTTKQFLVNQYPCLLNDMQFIVDYKGNIHHIDLDRCYDITKTEIEKKKIAYMNIFDDAIQQYKLAVRIAKSMLM